MGVQQDRLEQATGLHKRCKETAFVYESTSLFPLRCQFTSQAMLCHFDLLAAYQSNVGVRREEIIPCLSDGRKRVTRGSNLRIWIAREVLH